MLLRWNDFVIEEERDSSSVEASRKREARPKNPQKTGRCKFCKKNFHLNRADKMYCTPACGQAARHKRKAAARVAVCHHCGDQFVARRGTHYYCGKPCKQAGYRQRKKIEAL